MSSRLVVGLLAFALFGSAVAVVYTQHRSRQLFVEHQSLLDERDELQVAWGRLRLEQGTLATHARVERLARKELGLRLPDRRDVVVLNVDRIDGTEGR